MTRVTRANRRACPGRRGQSLVELALILPVLSLILFGAVDLGRVFFYQARLTNAVKEGAFYGAYSPYNAATGTTNDVRDRAYAEASGALGAPGVDFVIDPAVHAATGVRCYVGNTSTTRACSAAQRGDTVEVAGRYAFRPMTAQIISLWGTELWLRKTVRMTVVSGG